MTLISCLAIGLAFLIAVSLLVAAGVMIGWLIPRMLARLRPGSRARFPDKD